MPGNILIDPLDFMQKNLVVPLHDNLGTAQGQAGLIQMCLVKSQQPARRHGADVDKFILYRYRGQANAEVAFRAFWCPYAQNAVRTCDLDDGANLMFTATMDGCTFTATAQDAHGNCRVGHANAGRFGALREDVYGMGGARKFQADEQANRLQHALGAPQVKIAPADYMADHDGAMVKKSTTFAIRTGGQWRFYTQTYVIQGGRYFMREVTRHG